MQHEPGFCFVSYSSVDAGEFAADLTKGLESHGFAAWLDRHWLGGGVRFEEKIVKAIRECQLFLYVMTPDSVRSSSYCRAELSRALRQKKPVIPILRVRGVERPLQLEVLQHIDFCGEFDKGLAQLLPRVEWYLSPAGYVETLTDRLRSAERELLRKLTETEAARVRSEIESIKEQLAEQPSWSAGIASVQRQTEERIDTQLQSRRLQQPQLSDQRVINSPPGAVPDHYQARAEETKLLCRFLEEDGVRFVTVLGRAGSGKTTLVCQVLGALKTRAALGGAGVPAVKGIVYLSARGGRRLDAAGLLSSVARVLPPEALREAEAMLLSPSRSVRDKTRELLSLLHGDPVVVFVDNLEDVTTFETGDLTDPDLTDALLAIIEEPGHGVRVIVTTRVAPRGLALAAAQAHRRLDLQEGLEFALATQLLVAMDRDGTLGLARTEPELLKKVHHLTHGNPRAVEALFALLAVDRHATLEDVLSDAAGLLPEHVTKALVGELFDRVDPNARRVLQALAVYNRPVPSVAVDFLLQRHLPGVNALPILNRLIGLYLVQKERSQFWLHPVDREYAFQAIPPGHPDDLRAHEPAFTRVGLQQRGAAYYARTRTEAEAWRTADDLNPVLAQFDLLCDCSDWDAAFQVLLEVDLRHLWKRGYYRKMLALHERVRIGLIEPRSRSISLGHSGYACNWLTELPQSVRFYEEALLLARGVDDKSLEGRWLGGLADCQNELGHLDSALRYANEARELGRQAGARDAESFAIYMIAINLSWRGRYSDSLIHLKESLAIDESTGNDYRRTPQLRNIGHCMGEIGQYDEALRYFEEARKLDERSNNRADMAILFYRIARVLLRKGQIDVSLDLCTKAIELGDEFGMPQIQIEARHGRTLALLLAERWGDARAAAYEARKFSHPVYDCDSHLLCGIAALRVQDRSAARECFDSAVAAARAMLLRCPESYRSGLTLALALCGRVRLGVTGGVEEIQELFSRAREVGLNYGALADYELLYNLIHAGAKPLTGDGEPIEQRNSSLGAGILLPRDPGIADYYAATVDAYESAVVPAFRQFATAVVTLAQPKSNDHVLDLGTGSGILARLVAPAVRSVIGVDLVPGMIRAARSIAATEGISNAQFRVGDLYDLPFAESQFDLAISSFGLNSVDPDKVFPELIRVLRPKGRLVFVEWGPDTHPFDLKLDEVIARHRVTSCDLPAPLLAARASLLQMNRWGSRMRSATDYHQRLSAVGFQQIDVRLDQPVDCTLSVEHFLRYKLTWTHYRLELEAMGAARQECVAELTSVFTSLQQLDGLLHYRPSLFQVVATRS